MEHLVGLPRFAILSGRQANRSGHAGALLLPSAALERRRIGVREVKVMIRQCVAGGFVLLLGLAGCLSLEKSPFDQQPVPPEVALKLATLGQQIQQKNPDLPLKLTCSTVGAPDQVEIFSQVSGEHCAVFVTLGLIKKCKNDSQLAAVICQELGKAVAQHINEANLKLQERMEASAAPASVPIGNDLCGRFGPTGGVMPAEMERQDRLRKLSGRTSAPPADSLARIYLSKAGFDPQDLEATQPLLREASRNTALEKQMVPAAKP
jgi:hypothetical protein